jgi:membrane glycosyltransferase
MHVIVLPLMGYVLVYPLWMLVPTLMFLMAPVLNDMLFHSRPMSARKLGRYLAHTVLLYGSMFFVSLKSSVKSAVGGSVFLVTPKDDARVSFGQALRANRGELLFGVGLGFAAVALTGSLLPVLLLVVPALASAYLSVLHNKSSAEPTDGPDANERRPPPPAANPQPVAEGLPGRPPASASLGEPAAQAG